MGPLGSIWAPLQRGCAGLIGALCSRRQQPKQPMSTTGNTAQPAPSGHASVMHAGSECAWDRRQ